MTTWRQRAGTHATNLWGHKGLKGELGWVLFAKAAEFLATFALLKVLTNKLGPSEYGALNLVETALILLQAIALVPVHESFLRAYHGANARGELRSEMRTLFAVYALVTVTVVGIATVASPSLGRSFDLARWTILAAGLVFFFDRWRYLGVDYRNIRRERRASALHAGGYAVALVVAAALTLSRWPTATAALLSHAAVAAIFMLFGTKALVADARMQPPSHRSATRRLIWSLGLPLAAILVLQWSQSFGDRYLIKAMLDAETVGLYVAAYQVCGVPYTLLLRVCHELVVPVVYERAGDGIDPIRLWAADRVLIASIALQTAVGAAMLGFYALFGTALVVLLTSPEFALPTSMVVALAAGRWLQSLGLALQPAFALHHRTPTLLAFRALGSALTIGLCAYGIQRAGALGAALGGAAALSLYCVIVIFAPGGVFWIFRLTRRAARAPAGTGESTSG